MASSRIRGPTPALRRGRDPRRHTSSARKRGQAMTLRWSRRAVLQGIGGLIAVPSCDLMAVDQSAAPPKAPVQKDARRSEAIKTVSPSDVRRMWREGREVALLDAREEGPFSDAHPFFGVSLPLSQLE